MALSEAEATKVVWALLVGALILGVGWYYAETRGEIGYRSTARPARPEVTRPVEPVGPSVMVFEVDGATSRADLTMQVGSWQSQRADVRVPLKSGSKVGLSFTPARGDFLYISAQRKDGNGGTIRCRIKVDGVVLVENESSGPYTIATCSGTM